MRMSADPIDPLAYYARQSAISSPGAQASLFANLPTDVPSLCGVVQGGFCISPKKVYQGALSGRGCLKISRIP